ncbi:MAG: mandelate racemase/muconate lactonizing enzyme family protein [Chloroflexi bacterium]|nr:mandelate racemase/muconate lactonizing enzyme family protein [Chloroflexota bacterium]
MKITGMKTYIVGNQPGQGGGPNFVFLKLMTDEGIEGLGEPSFMKLKEHSTIQLMQEMFDFAVKGTDPFDTERLWRTLYTGDHFFQHPDLSRLPAISAFEMACWDIIGKATNQPVYNLLGGKYNEKLRSYTYMYGWRTGDPPERAAERAAHYLDLGFTALGFDPAAPSTPNPRELSLEQLRYVENVVKAVRDTVGDKMDILIKTHGQFTTHTAIRLAKRLEQFDPLWFEEPVPLENVDEMARVARSTSIPIATGERLTTKYEFQELLEKQAAQILQPALGCVGGLLEAKKIAGMAEGHYAQVAPWMHTGPVAGAASIQLGVCSPNFLLLEGIETWGGMQAEILKEPIRWEKGYIIPPTGPGLGVELNEEVAARHPYIAP